MPITHERWRDRLPHWEVAQRPHFVTIRCSGSLPNEARQRVQEIQRTLQSIPAADADFARLQRQYFLTCEKYLDAPARDTFCPFRNPDAAQAVFAELQRVIEQGWRATHAVVMPNHLHALLEPADAEPESLRETIQRFKGRTARETNRVLSRSGPLWQRDWFDRWMRNDTEVARTAGYIRNNPVKAGLVTAAEDWPWRIETPVEKSAG